MIRRTCTAHVVYGLVLLGLAIFVSGCGGGAARVNSSTTTPPAEGNNVQPIVVGSGPAKNYANGVFTSVNVCVPSSSTCQSIDGILVDTGSYGLRLLSSAGGGALTLSLPQQKGPSGNPIGECAVFVSGYTWGPVAAADISMAGEQASNIPVQIIDPTFASVPSGCVNTGVSEDDSLQTLGANGILGIGPYVADCGGACELNTSNNPGLYYECASASCHVTSETVARQVQNPVASFSKDNNGVLIQLPAVPNAVSTLNGSLVFGIGTQSNNGMGTATLFPLNSSGEFSTTYKGQSYPAFVDSGSNGIFFLDAAQSGLTVCSDNSGFYCPDPQASITAQTSSGGATETINFSVASADKLFSNSANFVFPTLAGPNPGTFDWGLPFFFGRTIFTAIESRSTPKGSGPFWAY